MRTSVACPVCQQSSTFIMKPNMRGTVACPSCRQSLTLISAPGDLACPLCRSALQFPGGKAPAGERVQCRKCAGTFRAEAPPPTVRVFASEVEACPACARLLAIPRMLPAAKKVRCHKCRTKFLPKRRELPTSRVETEAPPNSRDLLATNIAEASARSPIAGQTPVAVSQRRRPSLEASALPRRKSAAGKPKTEESFDLNTPQQQANSAHPPAPLPRRSDTEQEAANALLDGTPVAMEEIDEKQPAAFEELSTPVAKPAEIPTPLRPPRPLATRPSHQDDSDEKSWLETNLTRVLVGTLCLLATVAAGYYFFFAMSPSRPRVYPTEGIVLFEGKPAVGARVTLVPEKNTAGRFLPTGTVAEDGTFKLTTFQPNDGAPAGRYRVSIVRSRLTGDEKAQLVKSRTPEEVEQILAEKAADPLFSKYADAELTAEIPAPAKLRFELD